MSWLIKNVKARLGAKKFDIYFEQPDPDRPSDSWCNGYWIAKDGYLYYGHPLLIFFRSHHNSWWQEKMKVRKIEPENLTS